MADRDKPPYGAEGNRERGAIKKDWGGKTSIALVYPNVYRTAMSNLGYQLLYALLNKKSNIVAERVFLPETKGDSLRPEGGKGLVSVESLSPLQRFDVIAFSLPFENDFPNVLKILELGKIPILQKERNASHPVVMAGGVTTFLNPEPLALFMDFFLLGEAEPVLDTLLDVLSDMRTHNLGRNELLKTLARLVPSVYAPSLYDLQYHRDGTIQFRVPKESWIPEKVQAACQRGPDFPIAKSTILTPETAFGDRVLVELGRGCGRSCRFCAAGYAYRPPRVHPEDRLLSCIEEVTETCPRLGLISAAVSDTPGIERLTGTILERGGTFSVSSLRADSLTPELVENLKRAGQKTLAIAPEAGSERLRRTINKHLTREQIIEAVRLIARTGVFGLRLYFMVGLPTETPEDVEEILELVKAIRHHVIKESSTRGRIGKIHLSVNCFIPKASTPFQWFPMEQVSILKEKQKRLRRAVGREGGVTVSFDVPKWAYVQTLLSMGDRRVGKILVRVHEQGGDWQKAFRFSELNPDFYVYRPKGLDEILPWDFIDHGIHKEHLITEYKLALKGKESDVCRVGECDRCGVCRTL